jgi:surfactin synthase thioesterase subunit
VYLADEERKRRAHRARRPSSVQRASVGTPAPGERDSARWLPGFRPDSGAGFRLFCFHHAGGSSSLYLDWSAHLPSGAQLVPLLLPGRGLRQDEAPYTTMKLLVDAVLAVIQPHLDRPFAFFGHSMGALVAFATSCELLRASRPGPEHLFVSACVAPHRHCEPARRIGHLASDELARVVAELGAAREHDVDDAALIYRRLPILRADLAVCETYQVGKSTRLTCPMTVYGGEDDPIAAPGALEEWREYTAASFLTRIFPGNHFYLVARSRLRMLRVLGRELDLHVGRSRGASTDR